MRRQTRERQANFKEAACYPSAVVQGLHGKKMVCVREVPGATGILWKANSHFNPTQTGLDRTTMLRQLLTGAVQFCSLYMYIYIYKTQCASVCLSAIEIKLETFRYKQTYESYITFSREDKYGILISIRIVFGGLRAYIYSTVAKCATNSCHKITL